MHDATVFAHSKLGRNIGRLLAATPYHLIGDSAYALTKTLMKPYQDNVRLDEVGMQKYFFKGLQIFFIVNHPRNNLILFSKM